jgi:hypothetical protein
MEQQNNLENAREQWEENKCLKCRWGEERRSTLRNRDNGQGDWGQRTALSADLQFLAEFAPWKWRRK